MQIWTLSVLLLLTAVDLWVAFAAFTSAMEATKSGNYTTFVPPCGCFLSSAPPGASDLTARRPLAGLGSFISAKVCVIFVYLCVFGLTTEWMGSEVIIGICYLSFSLASTYVALMLFNALSLGGYAAAEAGFPDGCQDDRAERRPLKQQEHVGYQTQYI